MRKSILKKALWPLSLLNRILPKSKKRILFYSNLGFRDNLRAQFDYMIEQGYHKSYRIVCSISGGELPKDAPREVKFVGRLRGLLYYGISGWVFYVFGQYPIRPARGQCVVDLWHGMPLKRIGNLRTGHEKEKYDYFNYIIATSPFFAEILQRCFRVREEQVLRTGQPRCDGLLKNPTEPQRRILWMPTYRSSAVLSEQDTDTSALPFLETEEAWRSLDRLLEELDYSLVIKPHPLQVMPEQIPQGSRIQWLPQEELEREGHTVWDLFGGAAALITDYSSLYIDYMLLDRPIAFVISDMESYRDGRGFTVEEPERIMPGTFLASIEELFAFLRQVASGEDPKRGERQQVNALLNCDQTGEAAERILQQIGLRPNAFCRKF